MEYSDMDTADCPACERLGAHGIGALLGTLGSLVWFRCLNCGIDFNIPRESAPVDLPSVV